LARNRSREWLACFAMSTPTAMASVSSAKVATQCLLFGAHYICVTAADPVLTRRPVGFKILSLWHLNICYLSLFSIACLNAGPPVFCNIVLVAAFEA
jgi:hypothetical protein